MKFSELELGGEILSALKKIGYEEMTPIQESAIPHILAGRDLLGLAETGSGKTGACAVPLVHRVNPNIHAIQALILVPTRELALQYVQEIDAIAAHSDIDRTCACKRCRKGPEGWRRKGQRKTRGTG